MQHSADGERGADPARPTTATPAAPDHRASPSGNELERELLHTGRDLLDATQVEVFWLRPDASIAGVSEGAVRALGYSRDELLGMRICDLDPNFPQPEWDGIWQALRDAGSLSLESVHRCKDGRLRDVFISANLLVDGDTERSCSFVLDLTEMRRAATAVQVREERYRQLFDAAPDAVLLVAADGVDAGRVLDANRVAALTHGCTRQELVGMHLRDITDPVSSAAVPRRLAQILEHGFAEFEVSHRRKDGSWFPVLVSAAAAVVNGQRCVVAFTRDLTPTRRAEAILREQQLRLEMAAQASGVVFWDWQVTADELFFSPQWQAQLGYRDDEVPRRLGEWERLLHRDDRAATLDSVRRHLDGTGDRYESEFRLRHRDGSYRWIYARGATARDVSGKAVRMFGCHVDITARRQAEEERILMARQVAQLQKLEAIGTLAGGIAHDFNNILAIVQASVEIAAADVDPAGAAAESLVEIRKATERASALVRQIVTFSRLQAPDRRHAPLAETVREVAGFMRSTLPASIAIDVDLADDTPAVSADAGQIHQALVNLCTNAWHAMEGRPGRLRMQLRAVELDARAAARIDGVEPGPHVCLTVADDGVGIDEATMKRLFEPFFTTKPVGKGTGLGLSVVHGIVRAHGGGITVQSAPGAGATFRIYLPVAAEPAPVELPRPVPARGAGEHILLLDDEPVLLLALQTVLEHSGYRVTALQRPDDLAAVLETSGSDLALVVTDYEMPGASGLDVARRLRELRPALPVVLCSGWLRPEVMREVDALGIRRVIGKPFTPSELAAAIQGVLRGAGPGAH